MMQPSSWQVGNDKYDLPEVHVVDPNLDAKLAEQLEAANQGLRHAQKRFADLVSRYVTLACMSKLGLIALMLPMQLYCKVVTRCLWESKCMTCVCAICIGMYSHTLAHIIPHRHVQSHIGTHSHIGMYSYS